MALLPIINIGLKGFTAFWALITWIVAAAFQAKVNDAAGGSRRWVNSTNLTGGNVLIATGLLANIYFGLAFWFIFTRADHVAISVMADTIALGVLFLLSLGGTAALSDIAGYFEDCSWGFCKLGSGLIGIGWILTFLLLGILLFEVIYTLVHYGRSMSTWKTPFIPLLQDGPTRSSSAGISSTRQTGGNATTSAV